MEQMPTGVLNVPAWLEAEPEIPEAEAIRMQEDEDANEPVPDKYDTDELEGENDGFPVNHIIIINDDDEDEDEEDDD